MINQYNSDDDVGNPYSPIVVFATYWNEIDWIHASLEQINLINPEEVIICDGCFDPSKPNYSTDGTRKVIEEFVAEQPNRKMISAIRLTRTQHILEWFHNLPHEITSPFAIPRLRMLPRLIRENPYRLNQTATFNYMIRLSTYFAPNRWFMTYDCDQFYDDKVVDKIKQLEQFKETNILVSKEKTFFDSFEQYTEEYEKRDYNNMPHRAFPDTRFIPTRHPSRPRGTRYVNCSDFETAKFYVGWVYHYHIRSQKREQAGYSLGDRTPPHPERKKTKFYNGKHPFIITKNFLKNPSS